MGAQAELYSSVVWRKSNRSSNAGNCVEIASTGASVLVRDSHDRSGTVLELSGPSWRELVRRIRNVA
jgi:Domain of unknown function (DUF397)